MLFNSLEFVFLFLPLTLIGFYTLIRLRLNDWIFLFLVMVSLVFYSIWNPIYVLLLVGSVGGNYGVSLLIQRAKTAERSYIVPLAFGIAANIGLLVWFKYANFLVDNINGIADTQITLQRIILPLAISFYTLQQIAYLVDTARDEVRPGGFMRYATFVIFFPQLIAGPIVHYRDMMPQFFGRNLGRFWRADLIVGLVIFGIGMFKKTVIADTAAGFGSPIYDAAAAGDPITLLAAWRAAAAYTVQLYFDFSGYSDMAVGLARMFGIRLQANFHSPLRAASVTEYWRRWHMTLQQFIVTYMYQPLVLPLARFAAERGYGKWGTFGMTVALPSISVFLVIGAWHGANWTFVVFGLMHGIYITINEFWRTLRRKARRKSGGPDLGSIVFYHLITLVAVMAANVVFRANSVSDAVVIWTAMLQLNELGTIGSVLPGSAVELLTEPFAFLLGAAIIVALFPNTQQIMQRYRPVLEWSRWRNVAPPVVPLVWRLNAVWAIWTGIILFFGIAFIMRGQAEFIYFNF